MSEIAALAPAAHHIEVRTNQWPTGLKTLAEAAEVIQITPERLKAYADGGYAPHYRIDGGAPMFRVTELKEWAAENLIQCVNGKRLPSPVIVVVPPKRASDFTKVPDSLKQIRGLCDITHEVLRSGVYFLCRDRVVVYVGKSVNAHSRVQQHYSDKDFDSVLFLPWPADEIDRMEAAFIRALRPLLNGRSHLGTMMSARQNSPEEDAALIASVTEPT